MCKSISFQHSIKAHAQILLIAIEFKHTVKHFAESAQTLTARSREFKELLKSPTGER